MHVSGRNRFASLRFGNSFVRFDAVWPAFVERVMARCVSVRFRVRLGSVSYSFLLYMHRYACMSVTRVTRWHADHKGIYKSYGKDYREAFTKVIAAIIAKAISKTLNEDSISVYLRRPP